MGDRARVMPSPAGSCLLHSSTEDIIALVIGGPGLSQELHQTGPTQSLFLVRAGKQAWNEQQAARGSPPCTPGLAYWAELTFLYCEVKSPLRGPSWEAKIWSTSLPRRRWGRD